MNTSITSKTIWLSAALMLALSTQARADLITNGGFESGFSGWTRADQIGSDGTFFLQTGIASPSNGDLVPAPPGGVNAAMTDAQAGGSHVLYQDFAVGSSLFPATFLNFDLFIGNRAGSFVTPTTLDFATAALNQQARVDIMTTSANPFSVAAGDVLLNLFQTNPGDALVSGYGTHSVDVTSLLNSHLNQQLRLRFAEVDNLGPLQMGVDKVDMHVTPEPSTWFITSAAFLAIVWGGRRRISSFTNIQS